MVANHMDEAHSPAIARALGAASAGRRFLGRLGAGGVIGMSLVVLVVGIAVAGPWLAPNDPNDFFGAAFDPPSAEAWLGADALGRDTVSRVLSGGWLIILLSTLATLGGIAVGAAAGIGAGYIGGRLDEVVMRVLDVAMALPQIVLALLFVSMLGPQPWLLVLLVAIVHIPPVARVTRSVAVRIAGEDYIRHAESLGTGFWTIAFREILPNVAGPILVEFGIRFAYSITLFAGLSFLGFGSPPPAPDWGRMINENRIGLGTNPWPVVAPAALIAVLAVGVNLLTDAIARIVGMGSANRSE